MNCYLRVIIVIIIPRTIFMVLSYMALAVCEREREINLFAVIKHNKTIHKNYGWLLPVTPQEFTSRVFVLACCPRPLYTCGCCTQSLSINFVLF